MKRRRAHCLPRVVLALWFILSASCATSPAGAPEGRRQQVEPKQVRTSPLPGGGLRLSFEPVAPDPALERLRVEQARAVLADVHASPLLKDGARLRLVLASTASGDEVPAGWRSRLREELLSRFGPSPLPLPESLETSPVFQALKLSPRYMGAGVREAARELFTSPVFLTSVGLSVFLYFSAWLAPEPVFTKAFAAMLTLRLALVVGVLELTRVAQACVRLYQEAEAARSPQVPEGGLATLLRAPRFALPEGVTLEGASAVKMVADGTVVVAGVAAGTAAASGAASAGSACSDGSEARDGYYWHHLATNKNDISTLRGGPWTPRFEELFARAGMSLDAKENLVYLKSHKGPHPKEYHQEIQRRLISALGRCRPQEQCRNILVGVLKEIASEVCSPGSELHRLLTRA